MKGGQLNCFLGARGTPKIWKKTKPLRENNGKDVPGQVGEEPILGEGVGQGSGKAPPLHGQAGASPLPLSLHNPILMNGSATHGKPQVATQGQGVVMRCLPQKEEKLRRQVQFETDEELGAEPDLPADLTDFLTEGAAPDQKNTPSSTVGLCTSTKGPQHSLTLAGGAWPKVLAAASSS